MAMSFDDGRGRFDAFGLESPFAEAESGALWQSEAPSPRKSRCACGAGVGQREMAIAGEGWLEAADGEGLAGDELAWLDPQFEGEAAGPAEAWQSEDPKPAGGVKPLLGGKMWTSRLSGTRVTTFASPAALGQAQVDVLVYVHGLLGVCGWPRGMEGLIATPATCLAHHAVASGRPLVLVVPELQDIATKGKWSAHGLQDPIALERLIGACLSEAGRRLGGPAPAARTIVIGGHSRAYGILYPLIRSLAKASAPGGSLASLSEIWMIDASYPKWGGNYPAAEIEQLASVRPGLKVKIVYRKGSDTDVFKGKPAGGAAVRMPIDRCVDHCHVPPCALPALLSGANAVTIVANEDAPAESWAGENEFDEQWAARLLPEHELDFSEQEGEADFIANLALEADDEGWDGSGEDEYAESPDLEGEDEDPILEAELTEAQVQDYERFGKFKRNFAGRTEEARRATFEDVYDLMKTHFGSIDKAVAYYSDEVKPVDFYSRYDLQVHGTTLKPRLIKAKELIAREPTLNDVLAGRLFGIGGFVIRRNRNANAVLSKHSLAKAIDIDANLNPNLDKRAPARAMYAIIGEGFYLGESAMQVRKGGRALDLLPFIRRMRTASDTFKAAFVTRDSVEAAMQAYVFGGGEQRAAFEPAKTFSLVPHVQAIVESPGKKRVEKREALRAALTPIWKNVGVMGERRIAEAGEVKACMKSLEAGFALMKQVRLDRSNLEARRRQSLNGLTGPALEAKMAAMFGEDLRREVDWVIDTLIEIWFCYRDSFESGKVERGDRKKPQSEGNRGTIAANGYLSLPPELVAALAGSDGGGLTWLGHAKVKDMMHFEVPGP